jgi:hypothetical protein
VYIECVFACLSVYVSLCRSRDSSRSTSTDRSLKFWQ